MFSTYKYYSRPRSEIIPKLRRILESEKEVLLAIVFGSFVELDSYRDIDIAVYSLKKTLDYLAKLSAKLELELGIPVDITPIDELPAKLRYKILTKGIIILEKTPGLYEALLSQTLDEIHYINSKM